VSAIAVRDLTVAYNGKAVLDGVDLVVSAGEMVAVIGPNGSGKTTLLRAIAGIIPIRSGETRVGGTVTAGLSRREAARLIAMVPQDPVIPGGMSCFEYVLLGRTAYVGYLGTESVADRRRALEALERLGAAGFADRPIDRLSGGERQRVVLARALAQDSAALLLDEPTTALDIGHQQTVLELVDGIRREHGIAVLAAFHDLTLAAQYADRMVLLIDGEVVVDGSPATVLRAESLALFSGARATVIEGPDGLPIVVPLRRQTAASKAEPTP
jgi:iron complex transport system ATP-binding protein